MQWRAWKLKEKQTRKKFKDKAKESVNTEAKNLWGSFKDEVLEAGKEFCEKRKQRKKQGDTWCRNEELQEAIKRKKNAFREIYMIQSEKKIDNYKREKNQTRKIFSKAMGREAKQEINDLCDKSSNAFKLLKFFLKRKDKM